MKHSTLFLRLVIIAIGIAILAFLVRVPQTEGRAQGLDLISIYSDPFIIYGYVASIPFFAGLYQAIKLLGLIEKGKTFSKNSVNALRSIRNYALTLIAFIAGAAVFILLTVDPSNDDPAGFFALCIFSAGASATVAVASSVIANLISKKVKK